MSKSKKSPLVVIIGRRVKVISSSNRCLIGLEGKVVDETKNTIILETPKGKKCLLKNQVKLDIEGETINGRDLIGLPHERL